METPRVINPTGKDFVFEVHTYAPELNAIYYRGIKLQNIEGVTNRLTKSYSENLRMLRQANKVKPFRKGVKIKVVDPITNIVVRTYAGLFTGYKTLKENLNLIRGTYPLAELKLDFYYL